jgi:hypothetical protein
MREGVWAASARCVSSRCSRPACSREQLKQLCCFAHQLRAFGHSATEVYGELDKMRKEQFDLFERHVAFESALLADLGNPAVSAANIDSKGFDSGSSGEADKATAEANALLNAMNGVCKSM